MSKSYKQKAAIMRQKLSKDRSAKISELELKASTLERKCIELTQEVRKRDIEIAMLRDKINKSAMMGNNLFSNMVANIYNEYTKNIDDNT